MRPISIAVYSLSFAACFFGLGDGVGAEVVSVIETPVPSQTEGSGSLIVEDDNKLLQPAVEAFQAGDRAKFDLKYQVAREKSKTLPAAEIYLAKLFIESGKLNEALQAVETYLRTNPEDPEAFVATGEIAIRSGRWTDAWLALKHADQLIKEKKVNEARSAFIVPLLVELRAGVAEQRQQWDEADLLLKQLGVLRPEEEYPQWRQGRVQLLRGNTAVAIETMAAACAKNADLPSPELTAAMHFAGKNDTTQAGQWYMAAIRKDTKDPLRWHEYLKWLVLNERVSEAAGLMPKIPEEVKTARNVRVVEGLLARYQGDLAKAEQIFAELSQSDANDAEAADQLALVLIESSDEGKRGRALQLSELNLRRANTVQNVIATAAWVQFKLGAVDVADRLLGELASQTALQPQTAYYVARVLQAKGQSDDALKVLTAAVTTPGIFVERAKVKEELAASKEN